MAAHIFLLALIVSSIAAGAPPTAAAAAEVESLLCRCTRAAATGAAACRQGFILRHPPPAAAPALSPVAAPAGQQPCCVPAACAAHGAAPDAPAGWMLRCCQDKKLRDMYLPGTHDSGTYRFTTPQHMPMVLDVVLALLFNVIGDLSRTQRLSVYEQLQAGVRVLDIRLAVNPWLALQARAARRAATDALAAGLLHAAAPSADANASALSSWGLLSLDLEHLEGSIDFGAAGGALSAAELPGALVASHSLPATPLADMLAEVRSFLQENSGEVVVLMVKADTVDFNVAGSLRMTPEAWAAAADVFGTRLQGVRLLTEQQVQRHTLAELAAAAPGSGSVLIYSRELREQGLPAATGQRLQILESWGNGTNTEDVGDLAQRLLGWLAFWRAAGWRRNGRPYMLLASAEVTPQARTVLAILRSRLWRLQRAGGAQGPAATRLARALRTAGGPPGAAAARAACRQPQRSWWRRLPLVGLWQARACERQQQQQQQQQGQAAVLSQQALQSGETTLYQLGEATNQQLLQDVLLDKNVPAAFSVWSMDALCPNITRHIIALNDGPVQPE